MSDTSRLNVVIFAQYFPPDLGGSATRAYNVAKGLVLNGCDVTVVAAFPHYPTGNIPKEYRWKPVVIEEMDGFRVVRTFVLPLKSEGFVKRLLLMGSFFFSALFAMPIYWDSDVVWASSWAPAVIYAKIKRLKIALNVDDLTLTDITDLKLLDEDSIVLKIARIIYGFFYRQGDVITPISPRYIDVIMKRYGVKRERFHVIPAGVDVDTFIHVNYIQNHNDRYIVLYSGALSVAYDFDQIIEAAKILSSDDPEVLFIIQGVGELSSKIKQKINEYNLKNLVFIERIFSRKELGEFFSSADALILPLRDFGRPYLGLSTKLYEYQAIGKPILCCADGVPAEYIKKTNSGIIIKPGDYEALSNSILYLKTHPIVAKQMGENGRQYVINHLTIKKTGLSLKNELLDLTKLDFYASRAKEGLTKTIYDNNKYY